MFLIHLVFPKPLVHLFIMSLTALHCMLLIEFKQLVLGQVRESLATTPWSVMDVQDDINDKREFFHGNLSTQKSSLKEL